MHRGYIKIWRKLRDNDIVRDPVAFTLFFIILFFCDRFTGKMKTGRYHLAALSGQHPSTIRNALTRLAEKYKIVTAKRTARYTEIIVLKWSKYQQLIDNKDSPEDSRRTAGGQQKDTIEETEKLRIENIIPRFSQKAQNAANQQAKTSKSEVKPKKTKPCPLGSENHLQCTLILDTLAKKKNLPTNWVNYQKQIGMIHKIFRSGFNQQDIYTAAEQLENDNWWWDKWDMGTIASYLEKRGKETYATN